MIQLTKSLPQFVVMWHTLEELCHLVVGINRLVIVVFDIQCHVDHLQVLDYALCMWDAGSSDVSTYTTKDEYDGVEGWGKGGGFAWEKEYLHAFTYTTKAKWKEGGGDCGQQIYLLLLTSVS